MKNGRGLTPHRLGVEIKKTETEEKKENKSRQMKIIVRRNMSETETKNNDRIVLPTGKINHKRHLNCFS